jgi:uncharacterized protein (DUF305 family)
MMKRTMRISVPGVLLASGIAVGCGGAASGRPGTVQPRAGQQTATAPAKRANPADVEFMSGMIHHHAQAIQMAKMASTHGGGERIRILSERITVSQTDEIKLMQQWLREHGQQAPEVLADGRVAMGGVEHHMHMPGMLTAEQMAQLDAARGPAFDRLFLTFMIQHHEGALDMVDRLFATPGGGADDFIYKVASDTFADQGSEIDRMQKMLDAMGAGG